MGSELAVRSYEDVEKAALAMSKSGFFQDSRDASQAIVKILAGQELGFGPFASMTGVYIVQGRPSFSANIMAAAIKKSGRYNYRVVELTDTACEIEYYEHGKPAGRSRFTLEDARRAQTKNLDKFPRNMLFARAMSNGARWYCPDVFNGSPVYTPEELGANVDEEGNVIDAPAVTITTNGGGMKETAQAMGAAVTAHDMTLEEAGAFQTSKGAYFRDLTIAQLAVVIEKTTNAEHRAAAVLLYDAKLTAEPTE